MATQQAPAGQQAPSQSGFLQAMLAMLGSNYGAQNSGINNAYAGLIGQGGAVGADAQNASAAARYGSYETFSNAMTQLLGQQLALQSQEQLAQQNDTRAFDANLINVAGQMAAQGVSPGTIKSYLSGAQQAYSTGDVSAFGNALGGGAFAPQLDPTFQSQVGQVIGPAFLKARGEPGGQTAANVEGAARNILGQANPAALTQPGLGGYLDTLYRQLQQPGGTYALPGPGQASQDQGAGFLPDWFKRLNPGYDLVHALQGGGTGSGVQQAIGQLPWQQLMAQAGIR